MGTAPMAPVLTPPTAAAVPVPPRRVVSAIAKTEVGLPMPTLKLATGTDAMGQAAPLQREQVMMNTMLDGSRGSVARSTFTGAAVHEASVNPSSATMLQGTSNQFAAVIASANAVSMRATNHGLGESTRVAKLSSLDDDDDMSRDGHDGPTAAYTVRELGLIAPEVASGVTRRAQTAVGVGFEDPSPRVRELLMGAEDPTMPAKLAPLEALTGFDDVTVQHRNFVAGMDDPTIRADRGPMATLPGVAAPPPQAVEKIPSSARLQVAPSSTRTPQSAPLPMPAALAPLSSPLTPTPGSHFTPPPHTSPMAMSLAQTPLPAPTPLSVATTTPVPTAAVPIGPELDLPQKTLSMKKSPSTAKLPAAKASAKKAPVPLEEDDDFSGGFEFGYQSGSESASEAKGTGKQAATRTPGPFETPPSSGRMAVAKGSKTSQPQLGRANMHAVAGAYKGEARWVNAIGPVLQVLLWIGVLAAGMRFIYNPAGYNPMQLLPSAFDGTSMIISAAVSLVSVALCVAFGIGAFRGDKRTYGFLITALGFMLIGIAMITVTLASSGDMSAPPDGALLIPYVIPLVSVGWSIGAMEWGFWQWRTGIAANRGISVACAVGSGALAFLTIELSPLARLFI